jgi:Ca-activated chloride channel family protein
VLTELARGLGASRVFALGIGDAPNRALIEGMARVGRGAAGYVAVGDSGAETMDEFLRTVRRPAMTDVRVDWGGAGVREVYPAALPDLFVGRPVMISGRIDGEWRRPVTVLGTQYGASGPEDRQVRVEDVREVTGSAGLGGTALARLWARAKIRALDDAALMGRVDEAAATAEVRRTALDFGLLSRATAFLAVDSSERTAGSAGYTVAQPVPVPHGVRYDTAVEGAPQRAPAPGSDGRRGDD